jgi:hypothetical protein
MTSYSFYANKTLFSAQALIDCDKNSSACLGGNPIMTMLEVLANGLSDGNKYKWNAKNGTCQRNTYPSILTTKRQPCGVWIDNKKFDIEFMKSVVAWYGPITVLISKLILA